MTASSRTNHPTNGTAYRMTRTVTPTTRVQETDGALPPRSALSTRSPSQLAAPSWPHRGDTLDTAGNLRARLNLSRSARRVAQPACNPGGAQHDHAIRLNIHVSLHRSTDDHVPAACDHVSAHCAGDADVATAGDEIPADAGGVRDRDVAAAEDRIGPGGRTEPHCPARSSNAAAYRTADLHSTPGRQEGATDPAS